MKSKSINATKQSGFTFIEIVFGVAILGLLSYHVINWLAEVAHQTRISQSMSTIAQVPIAVQRRNAHDGYVFSLWDENGGRAPTNQTLQWNSDGFIDFVNDFLVAHQNPVCGNSSDGWDPLNTSGGPTTGEELAMERAALVPCNTITTQIPYNLRLSAALSEDTTGMVDTFALYLNTEDVDFGRLNDPENNILNFQRVSQALLRNIRRSAGGIPRVEYGLANDLGDIEDDQIFTTQECEDRLTSNSRCDIIVYVDYAGTTNGFFKRTDNQNFFFDDVTFGESLAAGRQTCAFWEEDAGTGNWVSEIVDCGIRGGVNSPEVTLIVDAAHTSDLFITNEADLTHMCNMYTVEDEPSNRMRLIDNPATNERSPCGITRDGNIVQLLTDEAYIGTVYSPEVIAGQVFASQTTLYSDGSGDSMLTIYDSTHTQVVFFIDNFGNVTAEGDLQVFGNTRLESDLIVSQNASFEMNDSSVVQFGNPGAGLVFSNTDSGNFRMEATGVNFEIIKGPGDQGISLQGSGNDTSIRLNANDGVQMESGTSIHASRSTLRDIDFDSSQLDSAGVRARSELVTADMAKYLDDTSSPIQIVGMDRVEGDFLQLPKPDCLYFMDDSRYSSPEANPYRDLIDSGTLNAGETYARLLLVPMYFKTYNSAFGDNQIFAQHAVHSSQTTWDIYLYLSGEGAFGTGAREDGAGSSIAMSMCDYSSISFSRQSF